MNTITMSPLTMNQMPLEALPDLKAFRRIITLYDQKRAGRLLPTWKDFTFTEFTGLHSRLALSQCEAGDFRFRLFGTSFVELFGRDLTGEFLTTSLVAEQVKESYRHFKTLVDEKMCGRAIGRVPAIGRGFMDFDVLDLPLGDESGNVSHFLHVCAPPTHGYNSW